jgi:hypothetical protein
MDPVATLYLRAWRLRERAACQLDACARRWKRHVVRHGCSCGMSRCSARIPYSVDGTFHRRRRMSSVGCGMRGYGTWLSSVGWRMSESACGISSVDKSKRDLRCGISSVESLKRDRRYGICRVERKTSDCTFRISSVDDRMKYGGASSYSGGCAMNERRCWTYSVGDWSSHRVDRKTSGVIHQTSSRVGFSHSRSWKNRSGFRSSSVRPASSRRRAWLHWRRLR